MTSFVPLTVCGVSSRWLDVREGLVREGACISFVIACETFCLDTKLCYWVVSCSKNSSYAFLSAINLLIVRKWAIIWQLMSFIMIKYHIYVWLSFPLKHYIHISIFMVSDIWRLEIMSGSLLFLHVNDTFQANHKFSINWEIMCNVLLSEAFCLKSIWQQYSNPSGKQHYQVFSSLAAWKVASCFSFIGIIYIWPNVYNI